MEETEVKKKAGIQEQGPLNKVIHKRLTLLPTKRDWESWEKRIEIYTNIFVPQSFPQLSTHMGFTHQYHTQYHKHTGVQWYTTSAHICKVSYVGKLADYIIIKQMFLVLIPGIFLPHEGLHRNRNKHHTGLTV